MGIDEQRNAVEERLAAKRRWDELHRFERDEDASKLAALTPQEGYEQFLSLYRLFGVRVPADLIPLAEADFRERVALVARRQKAFAVLAAAASGREGLAPP